jgi:hypothetical protein
MGDHREETRVGVTNEILTSAGELNHEEDNNAYSGADP